ncbi:recombinase RecT [Candidatus Stoquefichus massiliensis]|uniref:recombinase RecT n=1 Tax=Candidatus Stoquefichus massiliensis TaxID=1470350 RepID=UPI0004ADD914|nr:recombinase RecT [Candidatus Stoquefichus massiliensis]
MVQNSLTGKSKNLPMNGIKAFNNLMGSDLMKTKIYQMVGRTDAQEFITSITSAVNNNPALAECDSQSIISAALLGQSLHLKPSPQLGYFYMVPYKKKAKYDKQTGQIISPEKTEAQFQLGYKGYLQLAIRTGEYIDIDAIEIREGEYKGRNRLTGKPEFEFVDDDAIRENLPIIGYMAYFEMKNGYIKRIYWSKEKMLKHADEFSQAFSLQKYHELQEGKIPQKDLWKYSSFWYKNFDEMAKKTMLRQLLSKHGLLSTEMQRAVESDQAVITEDLKPEYVDHPDIIDNDLQQTIETPQIEQETSSPSLDLTDLQQEIATVDIEDDPMA